MAKSNDPRDIKNISLKNKILIGLAMFCPFSGFKKLLYRMMGAKIGKNVFFGPQSVIISKDYKKVDIGDNVFFSLGMT